MVRRAVDSLAANFPETDDISQPLLTDVAPKDELGYYLKTHGMTLREGDLVAFRDAPDFSLWEGLTTTPTRFSALGVITFSETGLPGVARQG